MAKRYLCVWFPFLVTDWFAIVQPELKGKPFVVKTAVQGRQLVMASSMEAVTRGIHPGMVLADARAIHPSLEVLDEKPELIAKLLTKLASWCIRFSPVVAADYPGGLLIDASGCAHLWGGEEAYVRMIKSRLEQRGYRVRLAMADTVGAAWAVAHFEARDLCIIVAPHQQRAAIQGLPPESLRLESDTVALLHKLGLRQVQDFLHLPVSSLRRRFGLPLLKRINQALGREEEILLPVEPPVCWQERLSSFEPIRTATGIAIALETVLGKITAALAREGKGLRKAIFKSYCIDGRVETLVIGTNRASHQATHLFRLFEPGLGRIRPELGIELFVLEAPVVEELQIQQEKIWEAPAGLHQQGLAELLDRITARIGQGAIHRYLPDEHYWPERSVKEASSLTDQAPGSWPVHPPRPLQVLPAPQQIEVMAPVPDYPPMLFRYQNQLHKIVKADGPERIEQEWWIQDGQHRDYYCVEDEAGLRYWLFRLGHYADRRYQWFIHGFFA